MSSVYSNAVICHYENQLCNIAGGDVAKLEPDITDFMATSTNYDGLQYVWTEWHHAAGRPIREDYKQYVTLMNNAAHQNGEFDKFFWDVKIYFTI